MRHTLLLIIIISFLTSCMTDRREEIKYEIYSSILNKTFGHISQEVRYVVGINDTIRDFKDQLGTLIYSVQSNDQFFNEYCKGDTSFKSFILTIKNIKTDKELIDLEKLKSITRININFDRHLKPESWHKRIDFSKVVLNKTEDKGILFIVDNTSGYWLFAELENKKWTVKHEILSWTS